MNGESLFSPPRHVTDIADCYFYHVMDLPGYGEVGGEWDLRGTEESYLGGVSFQGKRVLELGTASGYLCRYMEGKGADVIGFDLSAEQRWDLIPFAELDLPTLEDSMKNHIERLKNGWWFAHHLFGDRARAVYGNIYDIPREIGPVDIATFGAILVHLRDPFQALRSALRLTRETVIVTEVHPDQSVGSGLGSAASPESPSALRRYLKQLRRDIGLRRHVISLLRKTNVIPPGQPDVQQPPCMYFVPNPRAGELAGQVGSWWYFQPEVICRFIGVLGFGDQVVTEHFQNYQGRSMRLYTVVGKRTLGRVEEG
jgi:hypothetical protein